MKEKYYLVSKTITRWKLDNFFENWLGSKADKSEFWKKMYVLYYYLFDNKYYKRGLELINKEIEKRQAILRKTELGDALTTNYLRRDIIYSLHRFGVNFFEYFVYRFYEKNSIGRSRFNNLRIQYGYCDLVNAPFVRELFDNKGKTYEHFQRFYKRDVVTVMTLNDRMILQGFLYKHKSFIVKPLYGVSGHGIVIYHDFDESIDSFLSKEMNNGPFVVEELIEQVAEMALLHKESINSIRITTFKIGQKVIVYGAGVRMGIGKSVVDNAGSGGIFCHVNHINGYIDSYGRNRLGEIYECHPDTKVEFIGYQIPHWNDLMDLVREAALVIEEATVIAWDWACSKSGWVLLEANDVGGPHLVQDMELGNKHVLHELMDKYFEYRKQSKK